MPRLANSLNALPKGRVTLLKAGLKSIDKEEVLAVAEVNHWRDDIMHYLQKGENPKGTMQIDQKFSRYFL